MNTTVRTYNEREYQKMRETDMQRAKRLLKRRMRRFVKQNAAKMLLIGLPLAGLLIGLFIGIKAANYANATTINDYGRHQAYSSYVVRSGDTVWDIASDLAALNPEYNDVRQYVYEIEKLNHLSSGTLKSGQVIIIPYYVGDEGLTSDQIYEKYGITAGN